MIRGAIFDMDGTLLNSMPVWECASERYLRKCGITVKEKLSETLFSMSMRQGASYVKEKYALTQQIDEIVAGVNAVVFRAYENEVQPKAGVKQLLDCFERAGIKMTVATSTDRPMAEAALKRTGLISYFERIDTCTEIGAGKVRPDIFIASAEFLHTKRQETWVFEDALYAIETAHREGFRTVGLYDDASRGEQEKIKAAADIYLRDMTDAEGIWRRLEQWQ